MFAHHNIMIINNSFDPYRDVLITNLIIYAGIYRKIHTQECNAFFWSNENELYFTPYLYAG